MSYVICRYTYNVSSYKILYLGSSGSLVIAVKLEPKQKCLYSCCVVLCFIEKIPCNKSLIFKKNMLYLILGPCFRWY